MAESDRHDELAELLRIAGARAPLQADRAQRILAGVVPAWRRAARRARLRRAALLAGVALSLAVTAGLGLVTWRRGQAAATIAETVRVVGADALLAPSAAATAGAPLAPGLPVRTGDRLTTGQGRVALRLRDGASLRLDRETAVRFVSSSVVALDRGALYLDSDPAGGSSGGVEVRTPLARVQEIGTQFEVRLAEGRLRVRVREGAVLLMDGTTRHQAEAEDEITLRADGAVERGVVPGHGPEWDWAVEIAPGVDLDDRSLEAFLAWVARETGWTVVLSDIETARIVPRTRVHAPFSNLPPSEALPIVLAACELSHRLEDGVLTVGPAGPRGAGGL